MIDYHFVNLRDELDEQLLIDTYSQLYVPAFPIIEEQESLDQWRERLSAPRGTRRFDLHVIVAGQDFDDPTKREVWGFVAFEYYYQSQCGLVTYVAVKPGFVKSLAGRRPLMALLRKAEELLQTYGKLNAIFGEINDPALTRVDEDSVNPEKRMRFFDRLEARLIPLNYIQPPLEKGKKGATQLFLITFPPLIPGLNVPKSAISTEVVRDFLSDFFSSYLDDPGNDSDLQYMLAQIEGLDSLPLLSLQIALEKHKPAIKVGECGVACHALQEPQSGWKATDHIRREWERVENEYLHAPTSIKSFEQDLLSHAHRNAPPFYSKIDSLRIKEASKVTITFPRRLFYEIEGETRTFAVDDSSYSINQKSVVFRLSLLRTHFSNGSIAFHAVLNLEPGYYLSEFELAQLAKQWCTETDDIERLHSHLKIKIEGIGNFSCLQDAFGELFKDQFAQRLPLVSELQLDVVWGVTIQIIADELADKSTVKSNTPYWPQLKTWLEQLQNKPAEASLDCLKGMGGILQAIVDLRNVDSLELKDMLKVEIDDDKCIGIHRGLLLSIGSEDRAYRQAKREIGISPYLLIPHAVLLHNEAMLHQAIKEGKKARLFNLGSQWSTVSRFLDRFHLPNIFQYPTERMIFEYGEKTRGLQTLRESVKGIQSDLRSRFELRNVLIFTGLGIILSTIGILQGIGLWWIGLIVIAIAIVFALLIRRV